MENNAQLVLEYLDYFAGQEDTAEQVRDFVQKAAKFVVEKKPISDWLAEPMFGHFMEWLADKK